PSFKSTARPIVSQIKLTINAKNSTGSKETVIGRQKADDRMVRRIVIIGCGVSGTTASFYARKTDRSAEITIIGQESLPEYSRCGLPYAFSGVVPTLRSLVGYDEEFYEHTNRISLKLGTTAKEIDTERQIVLLDHGDGQVGELAYDSLILTTGARPTTLPVHGADLKGVFTIRTMEDVQSLADYLKESNAKRVAIIGAGLTGSEMAEALLIRKVEVLQAEIVPEILPVILDPDMAAIVREKGEEHGVEYHLESSLDEIIGKNGRVAAVKISGQECSVDAVVVAVKVRPNTELAKNAGIILGESGGIRTDEKLTTSAKNVFAAGDCIETYDLITRRQVFFQLATTAVRQAMIAGINAAGGNARYPGSTGVTTVKLFGLEVATVGPTTVLAERIGLAPVSVRITGSTRLSYYPGGKDLTVKLLALPDSGRLLGAQIVGEEGATLRGNFASMATHLGLTVSQFAEVETCYSPPLAPVWDPVTVAAQALLRKLKLPLAPAPSVKVTAK
ncbi:MAG TPA: FAD-dependent oxidoreductase, partial [Candidatus Bathyarchaeia archaeon]|nr:FAD-dependent oxidoreductase [Candidatus Bathyarchaeia archaeon]